MAKRTCTIEGCESLLRARGRCGKHYQQWRKTADPSIIGPHVVARRHVGTNGYVRVWAPGHPMAHSDGYALEHRKVWHDAGRDLPPGTQVHHKNHDRADNRIENLEAMTQSAHMSMHAREGVGNQFGGPWPTMIGKTCSIEGCDGPAKSRGWCVKHYTRWVRLGDPLKVRRLARVLASDATTVVVSQA